MEPKKDSTLLKMETKVEKIQAEALSLFKRKNEQYGNAFAKYGTVGVYD